MRWLVGVMTAALNFHSFVSKAKSAIGIAIFTIDFYWRIV